MKLEDSLLKRCGHHCELCGASSALRLYEVMPQTSRNEETCLMACDTCMAQLEKTAEPDSNHWASAIPHSMWNEVPAVQVVAWRILNRYRNESWAADQLDLLFLDEERLAWAKASGDHESDNVVELHRDVNGQVLKNGDTVVLIKSLDVKGSTLNAKMGTLVRNIRLVADNVEQIEGKVEGQVIVILTRYVRKQA